MNVAATAPDGAVSIQSGQTARASAFCATIQKIPGCRAYCLACDKRHFQEALKQRRPLRYRCYAGLREFVVPIFLHQDIVAVLMSGQIFDRPPTAADWRRTHRTLTRLGIATDNLKAPFYQTKVLTPAQQNDLMSLLALFSNSMTLFQEQLHTLTQVSQRSIIERADDFIEQHLSESLPLDRVAKAAGTSPRTLARLYRKERRQTVLQAIHAMRLKRACKLLNQSPVKCTQVALDCGFGTIQQFNRIFRAYKKTTPSRWRQQHRLNATKKEQLGVSSSAAKHSTG